MKKVVIVTGASSGIGKATALKLLKEDYFVVAAARRENLMEDLKNAGADVQQFDITNDDSIINLISFVINKYKRINILINNAGYGLYGAIADVSIEKAKNQFEVNLFGLARITQLVLPIMQIQHSGTIINISSVGGKVYTPLGAWYHASKHALEGFSDCLRIEAGRYGINVVIIEPGLIQTEWSSIAESNILEISGSGAYKEMAVSFDKQLKILYAKNKSSNPDVIAKVILKAIKSKRPKTRYSAGKMAKLILFMRKLLPDRYFDFLLDFQMKTSIY